MKFVACSTFALIFACALPGLAHAQSQPFDGPSIGVQGGWSQNKVESPETELGTMALDTSKDAATFGGFVGYDKTLGKVVVGAEAGFSLAASDTLSGGTSATRLTINPEWTLDVTARAGYLVTSKTLIYVRGGYINARSKNTVSSPAGSVNEAENRDDWLVGAGVEQAIMPNLSARLEYRYADLSEGEGTFDRHQTLLGVTYRF